MAKQQQDLSQNKTNTFVKGLNKDSDPSFVSEGMWTHARNAVNNTAEGDLGTLSNESSNKLCSIVGATMQGVNYIVGTIHLYSDKWVIYVANHGLQDENQSFNSEIGLFEEDTCTYRPIVQDACLGLSKWHLITGASREKEDCTWQAYWADGFNPDRYLNIGDPQTWPTSDYVWQGNNTYINPSGNVIQWPGVKWKQLCTDSTDTTQTAPGEWPNGHPIECITCVDTQELDCEKIRLARLMSTPCVHVESGKSGGLLRNGSYMALIAYSIKGQKVTDWFSPSNVQPIWFDNDPQGALEIYIEADKKNFSEFILCVVQNINQGAVAKQVGIYSTSTNVVYLDQIKQENPTIPIEQLPIQTTVFERSDQMLEVNNYLLKVGPSSKFDFNYQPLANLIRTNWVSVEYPSDYYIKGGYKPSYLRDEVYSFFIRWVYDTGDKSASYHIPGRPPRRFNIPCSPLQPPVPETATLSGNQNILFSPERVFEVYNTASGTALSTPEVLPDGGRIIARGDMGYWESTEKYPDNRPDIWNSSYYCWTGDTSFNGTYPYDLCGKPIRHHKFPDNDLLPQTYHFNTSLINNVTTIRLMGVEFSNIIIPKDNNGNDIPNIVGYEILRGSREGNKSIIAKGMVNNLRPYNVVGDGDNALRGLYPNHPFNTIVPQNSPDTNHNVLNPAGQANDPYIRVRDDDGNRINVNLSDVPKNITTFHSPDTNFRTPFLSVVELKLYGYLRGNSRQQFIEPDQHPKNKLIANLSIWMMIVGGVIEGIIANLGKRTINQPGAGHTRKFGPDISGGAIPSGTVNTFAGGNGTINTSISTDEYEYTDNGSETTDDFTQNNGPLDTFNTDWADYFNNGGAISESFFNGTQLGQNYQDFNDVGGFYRGGIYTAPNYNTELSGWQYFQGNDTINFLLNIPLDVTKFAYYFSEGADITLRIIYAFVPERQYALQMISHGFYSKFESTSCQAPQRFKIEDSLYLNDTIQELKPYDLGTVRYRVNNLKRSNTVVIRTVNGNDVNDGPYFISGTTADNSLVTIGTVSANSNMYEDKNKTLPFKRKIASHYAGLKYRIVNQYGQLESIKQIPITACETKFDPETLPVQGPVCSNPFVFQKVAPPTGPLFNGDTYINRYTEKNSMFFFYDWLYGQPNSYEYNYFIRQMIPEPRFMMNSERYESTNLSAQNFAAMLAALGSGTVANGTGLLPNAYYRLDNKNYKYNNDETPSLGGALGGFAYPLVDGYPGVFGVKESYFYLATSAVRDFFVESDVIVDFRETGVEPFQLHYDPYRFTDLNELFNINPDIITRGNYYSYDYSLSISKLFTQYFSQGNLQSRYYDPEIAKLCYTYYPDRIIYSLPQQEESAKDSWFVYLANNYKEFKDQISGVKNFAKTGIFITFKNSSPLTFQGVDQLQTEFGVKVTIGDGGLFAQTPQAVSVSDKPYEYGSSQSRRSVISTPAGLYYISQNQGKVMLYGGGLEEISQNGLKWWFNEFLPYRLLEDFPDYPHTDNPVAAIGCQAIYDNKNTVLYFTKKDYKVRDEIKDFISYDADKNDFYVDNGYRSRIKLGDPIFFEDASWTISYDPKSKFWISYHDWHPSLLMPAKGTFLSTYTNPNTGQAGIWKHGDACNSYCNYYGVDYPFEVEFPFITGQTVTTTRSMEYMLECYRRSEYNCIDQYHVLDHNFDRAVVFNSEQTSGYLKLNLFPKNNITLSLEYPQLLTSIPIEPAIVPSISMPAFDILFSKEENKYRFNQFWDITKDRGEFPTGSDYPPTGPLIPGSTILQGPYTNQNIWMTKANGYIKTLNPANLDYDKPKLQRKKFRHYLNFLNLTKQVSGDTNMIIKIVNVKNTYSPR